MLKFFSQLSGLWRPNLQNTLNISRALSAAITAEVKPTNICPNLNDVTSSNITAEDQDKLFSRLEIEIKSADPAVLKSYSWFATAAAQHLGIEVGKCWAQRKAHHDRLVLLKSVHIYKKHRVQYEIRTYYRFMNFHKLTGSTMDTFLEYIERNLPEGVAMKATKVEIQQLPQHLKEIPSN